MFLIANRQGPAWLPISSGLRDLTKPTKLVIRVIPANANAMSRQYFLLMVFISEIYIWQGMLWGDNISPCSSWSLCAVSDAGPGYFAFSASSHRCYTQSSSPQCVLSCASPEHAYQSTSCHIWDSPQLCLHPFQRQFHDQPDDRSEIKPLYCHKFFWFTFLCFHRFLLILNDWSQFSTSQLNLFCSSWIILWILKAPLVVKAFLHLSHS